MGIIVTRKNFLSVLDVLKNHNQLAVDTETYGLRPFSGHTFFSIAMSTTDQDFYFNFKPYPAEEGFDPDCVLSVGHSGILGEELFSDSSRVWYLHNAKFDMHMLMNTDGIRIAGQVHDTMAIERLLDNDQMSYSMDNVAFRRLKVHKDDKVKEWILENGAWEWETIPGKKAREKNLHYDKVPFSLIAPYAMKDTRITFDLAQDQLRRIAFEQQRTPEGIRPFSELVENELALTKVIFEMEQRGVLLDLDYCLDNITRCQDDVERFGAELGGEGGDTFTNSSKWIGDHFPELPFGYTDPKKTKGGKSSKSYRSDILEECDDPAAKGILRYRDAKKRLDMFQSMVYQADADGVAHVTFHQGGTNTGRFSCSNFNAQQLEKFEPGESKEEFPIRRAIRPRPGYCFVMLDYDQQEYRLMLDMSGAKKMIEKVLGGLDVHQATGDVAGISRKFAKAVNFAIIFGAGDEKLASAIGTSVDEAGRIRSAVLSSSPEIAVFVDRARSVAKRRGFVVNWFSRRFHYRNKSLTFKAPNFLCQGGGADCIKVALRKIAELLVGTKSCIVLQIHDELVLEVHKDELWLVPEVRRIMESVYPYRFLPLTVGVEHSWTSLADKVEGLPLPLPLPLPPE